MIKKKLLLLASIVILAAILRLWGITNYPAGFNADEAAYGYNAYSLLQTGKDEFGHSWPMYFESFADYKPGGTTYLIFPFVKLFGLEKTVVRLPSIIAGITSVVLIYLLVLELFSSSGLALVAALFLAISPWHIHFSRGAWETNLATTFLLLGMWLFFKGLKNHKILPLSVLTFAFSIYTYHTPRVVIPLLGVFLFVFYRQRLLKNLKWFVISAVVGILVMAPFVFSFWGPAVSARFSGVSVFADIGPFWQVNRARGEHANFQSLPARLLHNRPVAYTLKLAQNYLSHFDGTFLFVVGDRIKRSNSPETGEMYLFDVIFVLAGLYFLAKIKPPNWMIIFLWLLFAPLAASLTFQSPNALRAHNMVIPLTIVSAYGFYNLLIWINSLRKKKIAILLYCYIVILITWSVGYYLHQYFVHYPKTYPEAWEDGLEELVAYLKPIHGSYDKIYVTEKYDQPYIISLFYLKYSPEKFQKEAFLTPRDKFGFSTVRDFDNFHFENIDWDKLKGQKDILICGTDEEIPENVNIIKTINFRNGKPAFQCAITKW